MAEKQGKGWHGNSEGHARAGRKGGLARSKNLRARRESQLAGTKDSQYANEDIEMNEEERIRAEITAHDRELQTLRALASQDIATYQIDQLENELQLLKQELERVTDDTVRELHNKVHDLGTRIQTFSVQTSAS